MNVFERMYREIGRTLRRRRQHEDGVALVEYAILVAGIAVVVIAAVALLGAQVAAIIDSVI